MDAVDRPCAVLHILMPLLVWGSRICPTTQCVCRNRRLGSLGPPPQGKCVQICGPPPPRWGTADAEIMILRGWLGVKHQVFIYDPSWLPGRKTSIIFTWLLHILLYSHTHCVSYLHLVFFPASILRILGMSHTFCLVLCLPTGQNSWPTRQLHHASFRQHSSSIRQVVSPHFVWDWGTVYPVYCAHEPHPSQVAA